MPKHSFLLRPLALVLVFGLLVSGEPLCRVGKQSSKVFSKCPGRHPHTICEGKRLNGTFWYKEGCKECDYVHPEVGPCDCDGRCVKDKGTWSCCCVAQEGSLCNFVYDGPDDTPTTTGTTGAPPLLPQQGRAILPPEPEPETDAKTGNSSSSSSGAISDYRLASIAGSSTEATTTLKPKAKPHDKLDHENSDGHSFRLKWSPRWILLPVLAILFSVGMILWLLFITKE